VIPRWLLCGILAALCLLYSYWAFGGRRGRDQATLVVDGKPRVRMDSVSLICGALVFVILAAVPVVSMNRVLRKCLLGGMAVVFTARAIGDFKYLGFFKSVKSTTYAHWDTRVYSPLALLLAVLAGLSL